MSDTTGEYVNSYIGEILYYQRTLSTDERQTVEGYLAWKWGLQGLLPLTHPYLLNNPAAVTTTIPVASSGLLIRFDATSYSGSGAWSNSGSLGTGYNASIEAGTPSKNAASNGVVLNGSTNFAFPNPSVGNAWTASVWFKRTGALVGDNNAAIVADEYNPSNNRVNLFIVNNFSSGGSSNTLTGGFFNSAYYTGPNVTFNLNEWHNMVVSWDGRYMRTYYDGTLSNTTDYNGQTAASSGSNYRIGRRWSYQTPSYVVGEIGQILIYNRSISDSEALQNYRATSTIFSV
jgi:hypothetical protein